ncbi:glycosyltransferase family 2 protein [Martelella radicis]|uniref:Glycosyltransferase involved in cell wall biosynthesis n=1 Tax=Martelella radicis TaxID=1397476 RepID=A0A7W6KL31_9HYPH|nr:glycosyltransferase family 2 protein [Martelella radicis]MBB4123299.1 glycosyltransferase involved in cell wall biosynthesis [Martelella radicis]
MADPYSLDVVVPCYNEEDNLPHTIPVLHDYLAGLLTREDVSLARFRIILVDDGSSDRTWQQIEAFTREIGATGLKLSRNYGHQNAMLAGLSVADADVVLTIDSDLQDDINAVLEMLKAYQSGADLALGVRRSRGEDSFFKKNTAKGYYALMKLMGAQIIPDHADFRLMSQKALKALLAHEETNLFLRGIIPNLGFRAEVIKYDRQTREHGETKYTLRKMLSLAVNGVTSFSAAPLRFVAALGISVFVLSMLLAFWFLMERLFVAKSTVPGWASTVLPLLWLGGLQIFCMGIIGEYVGKIYLEVKRRPRFIIDEEISAADIM